MFKKILIGMGIGALAILGSFGALLAWAQQSGAKLQDTFFNAVVSGDPEQVLALCDPRLREDIDAPVLAAWMNEVQEQLGGYRGLSKSNFDTHTNTTSQGRIVESKGTVHFENGDVTSDLTFCNDLLVAFTVKSDKLEGNWFEGPTETELYHDRGEQFIRKFFAQDKAGAAALMAKELRKVVPDEKLALFMKSFVADTGELTSVEYRDEEFTNDDGGTLKIYFDLECEKKKVAAEIKFQFSGLKGHLEGFNFTPKDE